MSRTHYFPPNRKLTVRVEYTFSEGMVVTYTGSNGRQLRGALLPCQQEIVSDIEDATQFNTDSSTTATRSSHRQALRQSLLKRHNSNIRTPPYSEIISPYGSESDVIHDHLYQPIVTGKDVISDVTSITSGIPTNGVQSRTIKTVQPTSHESFKRSTIVLCEKPSSTSIMNYVNKNTPKFRQAKAEAELKLHTTKKRARKKNKIFQRLNELKVNHKQKVQKRKQHKINTSVKKNHLTTKDNSETIKCKTKLKQLSINLTKIDISKMKVENTAESISTQDQPEVTSTQRSISTQDQSKIISAQDQPEIISTQSEIITAQDQQEIISISTQDQSEIISSQDPPGIISTQDQSEIVSAQDPPGITSTQDQSEIVSAQDPPGITSTQDQSEIISAQDPPGITSTQDQSEISTQDQQAQDQVIIQDQSEIVSTESIGVMSTEMMTIDQMETEIITSDQRETSTDQMEAEMMSTDAVIISEDQLEEAEHIMMPTDEPVTEIEISSTDFTSAEYNKMTNGQYETQVKIISKELPVDIKIIPPTNNTHEEVHKDINGSLASVEVITAEQIDCFTDTRTLPHLNEDNIEETNSYSYFV